MASLMRPQPQVLGLGAAVLALAASLDRLAAAIGGSAAPTAGTAPTAPAAEPPQPSWQALPVRRLRALLRRYPIDRSSLPAPIETMRRAELLEALRQVEGLGSKPADQSRQALPDGPGRQILRNPARCVDADAEQRRRQQRHQRWAVAQEQKMYSEAE